MSLRNLASSWKCARTISQSSLAKCLITSLSKVYSVTYSLGKKCPNTEFFLVRIFPYSFRNTDQKKLRIWTHFMQWLRKIFFEAPEKSPNIYQVIFSKQKNFPRLFTKISLPSASEYFQGIAYSWVHFWNLSSKWLFSIKHWTAPRTLCWKTPKIDKRVASKKISEWCDTHLMNKAAFLAIIVSNKRKNFSKNIIIGFFFFGKMTFLVVWIPLFALEG